MVYRKILRKSLRIFAVYLAGEQIVSLYSPIAFSRRFSLINGDCFLLPLGWKGVVLHKRKFLDLITPTLFRDYHLYYIISILSLFSTVLGLIFLVIFSLSSLVLQNMLQLSLLNSIHWFTPLISQTKSPTSC